MSAPSTPQPFTPPVEATAIRNVLAEDQVIGVRVRKAGYSVRLSHHVVENVNRQRSFRWFLNPHSRWYKIRRQMALPTFLIEPSAIRLRFDSSTATYGICRRRKNSSNAAS